MMLCHMRHITEKGVEQLGQALVPNSEEGVIATIELARKIIETRGSLSDKTPQTPQTKGRSMVGDYQVDDTEWERIFGKKTNVKEEGEYLN